ncbi:hypothetical protein AWENTII_003987 [Aspergillus wentii]
MRFRSFVSIVAFDIHSGVFLSTRNCWRQCRAGDNQAGSRVMNSIFAILDPIVRYCALSLILEPASCALSVFIFLSSFLPNHSPSAGQSLGFTPFYFILPFLLIRLFELAS